MRIKDKKKSLLGCLGAAVFILIFLVWGSINHFKDFLKISRKEKRAYDRFVAMTESEKQQYVLDYLRNKYDLDCSITMLKRRQDNVFFISEKNTYGIATTPDGWDFSVWVKYQTAEIVDTAYTYYLKDAVNRYIETLFTEAGYECRVESRLLMQRLTEEVYDDSSISQLLASECLDTVISVKVKSSYPDRDKAKNILKGMDCRVDVYVVDNLDDEVSLDKADFSYYIQNRNRNE